MSKWKQMKLLADKVRDGDEKAAQVYLYEFRHGSPADRDMVLLALTLLTIDFSMDEDDVS